MFKLLLRHPFSIALILVFIFCIGLVFSSCKKIHQNDILDLVYIEGIHDDPEILTADSFFLNGKLKEAVSLFKVPKHDVSKQLYCQARLAEMDYYLRELYGKEHHNQTLDSVNLPTPVSSIDSFLIVVYDFYSKERLDTAKFNYVWGRVIMQLDSQHYLTNLGNSILGEYFYTMNFNDGLLDIYFKQHQGWCKSLPQKIYDGFWTNVRLTSAGTYSRNHLESIAQSNELIEDQQWRPLLDSVHLSFAYSTRGYILFRFDNYQEAYDDNEVAIKLANATTAVPVYQEALKSQLTVTNFWEKDSLWQIFVELLDNSIANSGKDYVNYHRQIGMYYFIRNEYSKSLPHHQLAINYVLGAKHLNIPVLASLCNLNSIELEKTGLYTEAIEVHRLGESGNLDKIVKFEDLIDTFQLRSKYSFVALVRYGHIYFSWFKKEGKIDLLAKAEELALLAHQYYFRDVDTREENTLITFSFERNLVLELLCLIYAEKYFRFNDANALLKYHQYSEENRGAIFWKAFKSEWNYDSTLISLLLEEQQITAENKRLHIQRTISQPDLEKNIASLQKIQSRIKQGYPEYYNNELVAGTPQIEEIQDTLFQSNASLLAFNIIDNEIYLLWLQGCSEELFKIEFLPELKTQLLTLINLMSTKNDISAMEYSTIAYDIWNWLIPDRVQEDTNSKWIIIPDGYFHRLNLEALVTDLSSSKDKFNALHWLINQKEITYTPLVKSWLHKKQNSTLVGKNVVGFAWSDEHSIRKINNTELPELPGSITEMKTLITKFPGARIFNGDDATRKNFEKWYTDPETRLMYLALHGRANGEKQEDINLYFRTKTSEADTFYGYGLLPFISNVETVILSGCETGKGRIVEGEGNYNLPRYFLANGANEVISSLWLVDDDASARLFTNFYGASLNQTSIKKLRIGKLELISNSQEKFDHPYYWANVILQE